MRAVVSPVLVLLVALAASPAPAHGQKGRGKSRVQKQARTRAKAPGRKAGSLRSQRARSRKSSPREPRGTPARQKLRQIAERFKRQPLAAQPKARSRSQPRPAQGPGPKAGRWLPRGPDGIPHSLIKPHRPPARGLTGASGRRYRTKPMQAKYANERVSSMYGTPVRYLSATERSGFEVFVDRGKLVDRDGNALDTFDAKGRSDQRAIFVMDAKGRIYLSPFFESGVFHHSSLVGGKPVAAAGEMMIRNGVLLEISRKSGHYKPAAKLQDQVAQELQSRGLDLSGVSRVSGY